MLHPKFLSCNQPLRAEYLTPVYPLVAGLTQTKLRPLIAQALLLAEKNDWLTDFLPTQWLEEYQLPTLSQAIRFLHMPPSSNLNATNSENSLAQKAQQRIGIEALMAHHIALHALSKNQHQSIGIRLPLSHQDLSNFLSYFQFEPTNGQRHCLDAFKERLESGKPLCHLLQGDVGSGKTLLAASLAFAAANNGYQAAVMAPTDLLASQHAKQFQTWFAPLGIRVGLLSGRLSAKDKREMQKKIACGKIDVVVGTHALIQPAVTFQNLAACVIDEQHRFGVEQRLCLHEKGNNPHLLLMTATPIPRSLAMTLYGNLSVLELKDRPAQRKPICTTIMADSKRDQLLTQIHKRCLAGEQVYWVCPLITPQDDLEGDYSTEHVPSDASMPREEGPELSTQKNEDANLKQPIDKTVDNSDHTEHTVEEETTDIGIAAETAFTEFKSKLPGLSLGLVHGRMGDDEKAAVMARFRAGEHNLLIATTVIEVGIDVPNANIIVIESANRFGLSQLHQLRGRVGRGDKPAFCILLYQHPLNKRGKARLQVLRYQDDGFRIAEEDLAQRGPGLWLGTAQSGNSPLPFASFDQAPHLLSLAQAWSRQLFDENPAAATALRHRWQSDPMRYARA